MNQILGLFAFLGVALSLAVHVAALWGIDITPRMPLTWLLHLGVFGIYTPYFFQSRKVLGPKRSLAELRALFPDWVLGVGAVLFVYGIINFLLFMLAREWGDPAIQAAIQDGKFVLQAHGRVIRELSAGEYTAMQINLVRGFSALWIIFFYVPFAYFMFCRRPAR